MKLKLPERTYMLSISTTYQPATDLGYLLHKNPGRTHEIELSFGKALVAFPEATEERCTAVLLVDIDPVELVRSPGGSLSQYVNDRPYVASSFLATALNKSFRTAMSGTCKERPELAEQQLPLEVVVAVVPTRAGGAGIRRLFEPLGYEVSASRLALDPLYPEWGDSDYYSLSLKASVRLQDLLNHLYVLLPVLDAKKHYYIDSQEVQKLVNKGEGWLSTHPEKAWIVRSFFGRRVSYMREAMEQLANIEPQLDQEEAQLDAEQTMPEERPAEAVKKEKRKSLHEQRHERVAEVIRSLSPKSVIDLGCGEGRLLNLLVPIKGLDRIVGMDVSYYSLERATRRLRLEEAGPKKRERLELIHGSLMYRDARLEGFDVAAAVEVIEHLDVARLQAFERVVFECARPRNVIITTPNKEYNAVYEHMAGMRHEDHRFEWTRAEFAEWCNRVGAAHNYSVQIEGVGDAHEEFGNASQMAVFKA